MDRCARTRIRLEHTCPRRCMRLVTLATIFLHSGLRSTLYLSSVYIHTDTQCNRERGATPGWGPYAEAHSRIRLAAAAVQRFQFHFLSPPSSRRPTLSRFFSVPLSRSLSLSASPTLGPARSNEMHDIEASAIPFPIKQLYINEKLLIEVN